MHPNYSKVGDGSANWCQLKSKTLDKCRFYPSLDPPDEGQEPVGRAHERAGLLHDRGEHAVDAEPLEQPDRRLVQRGQLAVARVERLEVDRCAERHRRLVRKGAQRLQPLPGGQHRIRWVVDPDEAAGLIPDHITNQGQLNRWELGNVLRGEEWAFSSKRTNLLSGKFIVALHKRMFGDTWRWAGEFRRTEKNIGVGNSIGMISRTQTDLHTEHIQFSN